MRRWFVLSPQELSNCSICVEQLMEEKQKLLQSCRDIVDSIKEVERDIQAEVRGLYRSHDEAMERERKIYRSTYEERLQKVEGLRLC